VEFFAFLWIEFPENQIQTEISMKANYQKPNPTLWSGRKTNPTEGEQYIYQLIELVDFQLADLANYKKGNSQFGLIGYECEEGVRRNQGRIGAKEGANAIRKQLGKLPIHFEKKQLLDFGNAICDGEEMEACQAQLAKMVTQLLSTKITPIVLGGGHDIAYGHFCGIREAVTKSNQKNVGIINFDAHFDLRDVEEKGTSGTPFSQIQADLEKEGLPFNYFVLGIQEQGNTSGLFETADKLGVKYILSEDCHIPNLHNVKMQLLDFISECDSIYLTIDLDGFSSAFAPGVSATSPFGFEPNFILKIIEAIIETGKLLSVDIAELSPKYDIDNATAKLGARLAEFIIRKM
jgi:formiminoglutamase